MSGSAAGLTPRGPLDGLRAFLERAAANAVLARIGARPVAVGWATVELDRAKRDFADALGISPARFVAAADSRTLGAACLIDRDAIAPGVHLVLLEPTTEGRLAATLARGGEGPAVAWLAVARSTSAIELLRLAGISASDEHEGPLGPERLILDGPTHGPHRLVVGPAGTIRT